MDHKLITSCTFKWSINSIFNSDFPIKCKKKRIYIYKVNIFIVFGANFYFLEDTVIVEGIAKKYP